MIRWLPILLVACSWDLERMNDQPRCDPGEATPYLPDRRCDQPAPSGSVEWRASQPSAKPIAPTRATIVRGMDRYARFCAPCHGVLADGRSELAKDMLLRPPPSLHDPKIIAYPDVRVVQVIGEGYGIMPAYAAVLPPADRWAVVHYVRVLQRSQATTLHALTAERQQEAVRWLP